MMTQAEMIKYDMMVDMGICTADELNLAFNLVGNSWTETIDKIIYIRTGYRDFEQYIQSEMEDEEEEEIEIPEEEFIMDYLDDIAPSTAV